MIPQIMYLQHDYLKRKKIIGLMKDRLGGKILIMKMMNIKNEQKT